MKNDSPLEQFWNCVIFNKIWKNDMKPGKQSTKPQVLDFLADAWPSKFT